MRAHPDRRYRKNNLKQSKRQLILTYMFPFPSDPITDRHMDGSTQPTDVDPKFRTDVRVDRETKKKKL